MAQLSELHWKYLDLERHFISMMLEHWNLIHSCTAVQHTAMTQSPQCLQCLLEQLTNKSVALVLSRGGFPHQHATFNLSEGLKDALDVLVR